jgi:hypothetical protein
MGAVAAWFSSGLALAGLAMTMAALEGRRGALLLQRPSGNFRRIPLLASAFLLFGLASVGVPGTLGFVAEDLLVHGSVQVSPLVGLTLIAGTAVNGITVMRSFFALCTGSREGEPLVSLHGARNIVAGLEEAINDEKTHGPDGRAHHDKARGASSRWAAASPAATPATCATSALGASRARDPRHPSFAPTISRRATRA